MHPMSMRKIALELLCALLATCSLPAIGLPAQPEQQAPPVEESAYGSRFFDQLRNIFGRFANSDLQRVFQEAQPIGCSELVGRKGQWRTVAFFNENHELGAWCRQNLEEVRADLAVYTFTGTCHGDQGTVQVATEFPTIASIEAYNHREIDLNQIDVTVNDPVTAMLNSRTMAYTFDLPYLFLTGRRGSMNVYSLTAPDRDAAYATNVTSRWECKSVASKDVTYRFLICRTMTVPSRAPTRNERYEPAFGASAFFILSDGTEAQSSVNLTYGDATQPAVKPADTTTPPAPTSPARPALKRPQKPNSPDN